MMTVMLAYLQFWSDMPGWAVIVAAAVMAGAAGYILSRPSKHHARRALRPSISAAAVAGRILVVPDLRAGLRLDQLVFRDIRRLEL